MYELHLGDCLDVMRGMPENSVDTIITDPPYGLEFMGKEWDRLGDIGKASHSGFQKTDFKGFTLASYNASSNVKCQTCGKWRWDYPERKCNCEHPDWPNVKAAQGAAMQQWHYNWAVEALRVAKSGAIMVAFGGTRTFHRLTCAIEDAGWEIRDCMMWLYGSGFPKSHDISKAIDKAAGAERTETVGKYLSPRQAERGTFRDEWPSDEYDQSANKNCYGDYAGSAERFAIKAPATDVASLWSGWGTALKPAWEPIIVAMKPLDGTFAQNAQEWGVAGLWIDGGRIPTNGDDPNHRPGITKIIGPSKSIFGNDKQHRGRLPEGRWPANVLLDEQAAAMLDEQRPWTSQTGNRKNGHRVQQNAINTPFTRGVDAAEYTDFGGASRFFYCAKASRSERDEGLEGMEERDVPYADYRDAMKDTDSFVSKYPDGSPRPMNKLRNGHPTVKPVALLEYLCRLTKTPTGGVVLDPFMGSGTTGIACIRQGRDFIGIEISEEYMEIAKRRIGSAEKQAASEPRQLELACV